MHENLIAVYLKDFVITYNPSSKRLENKIILIYANGQGGNYFLDKIFSPQDLIEFSKKFEIL
jgi:glycosylphosphatidylinositol transamidase (GPIT) subunit GPI8